MRVTGREIVEAAEKNGYKQARNIWYKKDADGLIVEACFMGQINLNLHSENIGNVLNTIDYGNYPLGTRIMTWNDQNNASYDAILGKLKIAMQPYMDKVFVLRKYRGKRKAMRKDGTIVELGAKS